MLAANVVTLWFMIFYCRCCYTLRVRKKSYRKFTGWEEFQRIWTYKQYMRAHYLTGRPLSNTLHTMQITWEYSQPLTYSRFTSSCKPGVRLYRNKKGLLITYYNPLIRFKNNHLFMSFFCTAVDVHLILVTEFL